MTTPDALQAIAETLLSLAAELATTDAPSETTRAAWAQTALTAAEQVQEIAELEEGRGE